MSIETDQPGLTVVIAGAATPLTAISASYTAWTTPLTAMTGHTSGPGTPVTNRSGHRSTGGTRSSVQAVTSLSPPRFMSMFQLT